MATFDDFLKLDIRVGKITEVEAFPRARKPSYKVTLEFDDQELGTKHSAAQVTNYSKEELMGMQVICIVNFPPRNIAGFMSEVLILGVPAKEDPETVSVLTPSREAVLGGKVY